MIKAIQHRNVGCSVQGLTACLIYWWFAVCVQAVCCNLGWRYRSGIASNL